VDQYQHRLGVCDLFWCELITTTTSLQSRVVELLATDVRLYVGCSCRRWPVLNASLAVSRSREILAARRAQYTHWVSVLVGVYAERR